MAGATYIASGEERKWWVNRCRAGSAAWKRPSAGKPESSKSGDEGDGAGSVDRPDTPKWIGVAKPATRRRSTTKSLQLRVRVTLMMLNRRRHADRRIRQCGRASSVRYFGAVPGAILDAFGRRLRSRNLPTFFHLRTTAAPECTGVCSRVWFAVSLRRTSAERPLLFLSFSGHPSLSLSLPCISCEST